jgi:uncharacterized protein YndB with AHSA1/START domain
MKNDPIVVEQTLDALPEKVWKAITNKEEMKKWYFDVSDFRADPGFEFTFEAGSDERKYLHLCKVITAIPLRKLSYTWRYNGYAGDSMVTFELVPKDGNDGPLTTVRLTHEGVGTFPSQPDFAYESFEQGWNEIIRKSLKEFVETR